MEVLPPQAHNRDRYHNNWRDLYCRFDYDNKVSCKYILPNIQTWVAQFNTYNPTYREDNKEGKRENYLHTLDRIYPTSIYARLQNLSHYVFNASEHIVPLRRGILCGTHFFEDVIRSVREVHELYFQQCILFIFCVKKII